MKYKVNEDGSILVNESGLPIIIEDDGKEFGLDGIGLYTKIPTLNEESKAARKTITGLNEKLNAFKDIEDPVKAIEALKIVQNLSDKKLVDAGEVDKIETRLKEAFEANMKETELRNAEALRLKDVSLEVAVQDLFDSLVSSQFAKSDYFTGSEPKTKLTPAIGLAYFKSNFKVEEDVATGNKAVVGYYSNGEKIVSQQNPLKSPTFDEAIGAIIENHPDKTKILNESAGGGAQKNKGGITIVGLKQISGKDVDVISGNLDKIASGELTVVSSQG